MKKALLILTVLFFMTGCNNKQDDASADKITTNEAVSETAITTEIVTEATTEKSSQSLTTTVVNETITKPSTETINIPNDGKLVRILDYIPDAFVDLRYATDNNFTGVVLYDDSEAYLCYGTVKKLIMVQNELREKGYSILIWDAYRTPEAQQRLWEAYPDPTFVADPRNGLTSHSKGNTIDISIVLSDGSAIEMPSKFDEFSAVADRNYNDVSEVASSNAKMLEDVMYRNGFTGYKGEWWDYSDIENYTIEPISEQVCEYGDEYITAFFEKNGYSFKDVSKSNQLIVIESTSMNCKAHFYQKDNGKWTELRFSNGIVGKNGTTTNKVEGDYCTPKGIYSMGFGFGTEQVETNLEYRILNDNCYWVDDPKSDYYNQWVESNETPWDSAEHLSDYPKSYHYAIVIEYNAKPIIPNKGSAIFLHCMTGSYTAGCIAIPDDDMLFALNWLDANSEPMIVIS